MRASDRTCTKEKGEQRVLVRLCTSTYARTLPAVARMLHPLPMPSLRHTRSASVPSARESLRVEPKKHNVSIDDKKTELIALIP